MAGPVRPRQACAAVACELCPDVVEWCHVPGFEELLAYGTYQLEEATGSRTGALHLARAGPGAGAGSQAEADAGRGPLATSLQPLAEVALPGVYDVAWAPPATAGGRPLLAVAAADGALRLLAVTALGGGGGGGACEPVSAPCQLLEGAILTHVVWGAGGPQGLAAVGQDGAAHHVETREDGSLALLARRQVHELEAWCVEVPPESPHCVLTGADDGSLLGWDLREPPDAAPALASRRGHGAGVTALACSPWRPHCVASGSYDERVRLLDLRALAGPALAESERLGDGAYHLAWHPGWPGVLAVAAMRSGLPLLLAGEGAGGGLLEWGRYAADAPEGCHGSLAYGVSWRRCAEPGGSAWLAASASFYDRSVHLWSVPRPEF